MPTPPYDHDIAGPRPAHWHEIELTRALEIAFRNRMSALNREHDHIRSLDRLAELQARLSGWRDAPNQVAVQLAFRARGSFLAACDLAMAGMAGDVYSPGRAALEHAAMAATFVQQPQLIEVWERRPAGGEDRAKARKIGRAEDLKTAVAVVGEDVATLWNALYDTALEAGPHPNALSVWLNADITKDENGHDVVLQKFFHDEGPALTTALCWVEDVGACLAKMFTVLFPERYEGGHRDQLDRVMARAVPRATDRLRAFTEGAAG